MGRSGMLRVMDLPISEVVTPDRQSSATPPLHDVPPREALRAWLCDLARGGRLGAGESERCPLAEAAARILSKPVHALQSDPVSRCAAMDGVAVRAADTAAATELEPVVLEPARFAVVDTGQAVDSYWDAVVPHEQFERAGDTIVLHAAVGVGEHVRAAGENVRAAARILEAGTRLTAYDLALAAACGHTAVEVHARPRVVVIPTGNEIRPRGSSLAPGEAIDANSLMLSILARELGADVSVTSIIADGEGLLERQLRESCRDAHLVLVIAGSARGTRDRTASVIGGMGSVVVRGVALRPAHPVILGVVERAGVIGMPGYPVSTSFAFERFARPVIELLSGLSSVTEPIRVPARLSSEICGRADAEVQVPVRLHWGADELPDAHPGSRRGSSLAALAHAHGIVSLPAGGGTLVAGEIVQAELLPSPLATRHARDPTRSTR
jgi:putative molybdopterin biosynthesis protein